MKVSCSQTTRPPAELLFYFLEYVLFMHYYLSMYPCRQLSRPAAMTFGSLSGFSSSITDSSGSKANSLYSRGLCGEHRLHIKRLDSLPARSLEGGWGSTRFVFQN